MNAVAKLVDVQIATPSNTVETRAQDALARANALVIMSPEQYANAAAELQTIKGKWNEVEAQRKELVKPINEAHARIQNFFRGPLNFLSQAEGIVKRKIADYQREQERVRLEQQRKADEAARKERERLEQRAAKAIESGKVEKAEQLQQQAASVVAPVVTRDVPNVAGVATREVWKYEITDPSKINPAFLMPDESKIGKTVRALKGDAVTVIGPGVRVYPDKQIAAGSRR